MKDKFIKNGVFSLEYDKETLRDMVLELQEENQELKSKLELYENGVYFSSKVDEKNKQIDKLKEWINIVQQNKDNRHSEPFIFTDELDELLDILKEVE